MVGKSRELNSPAKTGISLMLKLALLLVPVAGILSPAQAQNQAPTPSSPETEEVEPTEPEEAEEEPAEAEEAEPATNEPGGGAAEQISPK